MSYACARDLMQIFYYCFTVTSTDILPVTAAYTLTFRAPYIEMLSSILIYGCLVVYKGCSLYSYQCLGIVLQ